MAVHDHDAFYAVLRQMSDEELFAFFKSVNAAQTLIVVMIATGTLALREFIAYLGADWRTMKLLFQGRVMPARLAIIISRYGYVGAFVSAVIFLLGRPESSACATIFRAVYGLYVVLWGASGSIFLMRLNIIFARERKIMAFFVFLWLGGICLWAYVITLLDAYAVPPMLQFPFGPTCEAGRFPKKGAIGWAGSIVFDGSVFLATLTRFHSVSKAKDKSLQLRSRRWLFESNLAYFGVSMFFNTGLMMSSLLVNDPVMSNIGSAAAFCLHVIMATRLVYASKGWSNGDSNPDADDVILNTFNKNKRNGNGGNERRQIGATRSIAYTVEETVIRSIGAEESEMHHDGGMTSDDEGPERRQRYPSRRQRRQDGERSAGEATEDEEEGASGNRLRKAIQGKYPPRAHHVSGNTTTTADNESSDDRVSKGYRVRSASRTSQTSSMPKLSVSRAVRKSFEDHGDVDSLEEEPMGKPASAGNFVDAVTDQGRDSGAVRLRTQPSSDGTLSSEGDRLEKKVSSSSLSEQMQEQHREATLHHSSSRGTLFEGGMPRSAARPPSPLSPSANPPSYSTSAGDFTDRRHRGDDNSL